MPRFYPPPVNTQAPYCAEQNDGHQVSIKKPNESDGKKCAICFSVSELMHLALLPVKCVQLCTGYRTDIAGYFNTVFFLE